MTTITVTAAAGGTLDLHDVGSVHTLHDDLPALTATITYPGVRQLGKLSLLGSLTDLQMALDAEDFSAWVNLVASGNLALVSLDLALDGVALNADHAWYESVQSFSDGSIEVVFRFTKASITFV